MKLGLIQYNPLFIYKNGRAINVSFHECTYVRHLTVSAVVHFSINSLILLLFHHYSHTTCKLLTCKYHCHFINLFCTRLILFESLRFIWYSRIHYKLTSEIFSDYWMIQHFQGFGVSSSTLLFRRCFSLFLTENILSFSDGEEFITVVWVTIENLNNRHQK